MTRRKITKQVRINCDTLRAIREATPGIKKDSERIDAVFKTSLLRIERWLGEPPRRPKK